MRKVEIEIDGVIISLRFSVTGVPSSLSLGFHFELFGALINK